MVFDAGRVETFKAVVELYLIRRSSRDFCILLCNKHSPMFKCVYFYYMTQTFTGIKNVSKRGKHSKRHLSQLFIISHNYSHLLSFRNVMVNFAEEILKAVAIPAYTFLCSFFLVF